MAYEGARKNARGTIADEPSIGEKAFSVLTSFGAAVVMLKQGRMLQLQYYTDGGGTAKDLEAFRPVAKKWPPSRRRPRARIVESS